MACCRAPKIIIDSRDSLECCLSCGRVLGSTMADDSPEFYTSQMNSDQRTTRLGLLSDPTDSLEVLGAVFSHDSANPNNWHFSSVNKRKIRLLECFDELSSVFRVANIPESILPRAKNIFQDAFMGKMTYGRSRDLMLLCSIYIASKMKNIKLKLKRVAFVLDTDWSKLKKSVLKIEPMLLRLKGCELMVNKVKLLHLSFQLSKKIKNACLFLCDKETNKIEGKEVVLAGTFVYIVTRYSQNFKGIRFCDICRHLDTKVKEIKAMYYSIVKDRKQILTAIIPKEVLDRKELI